MSLKGKILIQGQTDAGLYREHNEDSIGHNQNIALAVLADGMGGHQCGEIASAITVSTVLEFVNSKIKNITPADSDKDNADIDNGINSDSDGDGDSDINSDDGTTRQILLQAVTLANKKVFEASQSNSQYRGMGTTVVAILFHNNRISYAHVGDSRLYRLRQSGFEQITRDHSYVQEMLDSGVYTAEQARDSTHKNVITRAIGIAEKIKVDTQQETVKAGDIYLLCSDGVNDMIDDETIKSILLANTDDLENAASEIIQSANKHGGKDNISALLAKVVKPFPAKSNLFSRIFNFMH